MTYLVLMLLGLGGLILWTGLRLQTATVEQAEHELELEAFIMANALREPLEDRREGEDATGRSLDTLVQSYARGVGGRVTLVDPALQVLLSSDDTVPAHLEHNHPEIVAARAGGEQHDIRWDEWRNEERLFVAAPILGESGELESIIQLSIPMVPLYNEMRRTWVSLLVAGAIVMGVTAFASRLVAHEVAGPVHKLTAVTEQMAAGDLEQQVIPGGPDEIKRLGQSFNRMAERVRETLARQQTFVTDAAHELRSPLTAIRLRIEMLQRRGQDNPELVQRYLDQMEHEVEHLRRLVDHLLSLSRLDEGQALPQSPLDLAPTLYELAEEMRPLIRKADLDFEVEVPSHLAAVSANAEPMRIIVRNLVDNAIKHTPAGGQITLQAEANNGVVCIAVSDSGSGIPAEHLSHIFDRFYRVDKTRSRSQGGAGLGLSLVRSIVKTHNGEVSVKSSPGEGSTFAIHLPTMAGASEALIHDTVERESES